MGLRNIPVVMESFKLMISEAPVMKMKKDDKTGQPVPATDHFGVQLFVVSLFAKSLPNADGYAPKGEEIKVTLTSDPGDGFNEGDYVSLIAPTVSPWSNDNGGGVSWRAEGLAPAIRAAAAA
ncbi:hypothetical protein [Lentzea cavernae]|uniref:Uncharacterized protein n=1 Tax=Lentzea cavernae TaxID=2020703 RepID=A0ABQ3MVZ2_9PSEU|nr:hypothetical protein [Lentzea cavernae]GHH59788.1 hypothetical protein GCM10017774_83160 [Lentzea cavernae]